MGERIPTEEVERLAHAFAPADLNEWGTVVDLAADLLDARRALAEAERHHREHCSLADRAMAEVERLREALEVIHGAAAADFKTGGTFGTIVGIESIARFALSGEETSG